jgi:hypothetical protein
VIRKWGIQQCPAIIGTYDFGKRGIRIKSQESRTKTWKKKVIGDIISI